MWHLTSTLFLIISDSMYVIAMSGRRHLRSELQDHSFECRCKEGFYGEFCEKGN